MTPNFVCPNCVTSGLWKDMLRAESDVIGSCTYCNSSDVENLEDFEHGVPIETFINMVEEAINDKYIILTLKIVISSLVKSGSIDGNF